MSTTANRRSPSARLRIAILAATSVALVLTLVAAIAYDLQAWHHGWIADAYGLVALVPTLLALVLILVALADIERRRSELEAAAADKDREVAERRQAQQEVMRLNEQLEHRVQTRTAQLEELNRDLLAASREAERANRAKSEFLSNMSHELRTPLNAIIGFGQLLGHEGGADLPPERRGAFVKHIVDAGDHLLTLINEILNLAQVESGEVAISLEPVELREVLEECHTLTCTASAQLGIRLLFPLDTPLRVQADRTRLKQVLLNLLSNAVKYNRAHGSVTVECAAGDEGRVRIEIEDTGAGLTPDQLHSLFQPFNRLGRDASDIEGSGIGLVLTKRLVELMGGTMGVRSTPGVGSTFWIDLRNAERVPIDLAAVAPRLPTPAELTGGEPLLTTVLCVDDNPANLELLTEALSLRADCRVLTATDGRTGVEMARSHNPDVILMDNNMPVMNGREAMRILRADPQTAGIPDHRRQRGGDADDGVLGAGAGLLPLSREAVRPGRSHRRHRCGDRFGAGRPRSLTPRRREAAPFEPHRLRAATAIRHRVSRRPPRSSLPARRRRPACHTPAGYRPSPPAAGTARRRACRPAGRPPARRAARA